MLVVACVSLVLNLLEIYHLGWKKVKQGVTNEFVPDRGSLLLPAGEPGDAETIPEQTSPLMLGCLPEYSGVSVVGCRAADGGAYSPTEASPTVISFNPNMATPSVKMNAALFHPDDLFLETLPASFYGSSSEKGSTSDHRQLTAAEQNWSNMALELHNLDGTNSSSSYPPPLPSPPLSASSASQGGMTPPPPPEDRQSGFATLPSHTPLYPRSSGEAPADEGNPLHDDFIVVTKAEMHQPPPASVTDIRKPRRASKSSSTRARPDDLAV